MNNKTNITITYEELCLLEIACVDQGQKYHSYNSTQYYSQNYGRCPELETLRRKYRNLYLKLSRARKKEYE